MECRQANGTLRIAAAVVAAVSSVLTTGCGTDELSKEFREATAASLESGLTTITEGLITGAFEVYNPDTTSDADSDAG